MMLAIHNSEVNQRTSSKGVFACLISDNNHVRVFASRGLVDSRDVRSSFSLIYFKPRRTDGLQKGDDAQFG